MKDKIIFWNHTDFIQLGLAKHLQSNHDCNLYAIIDVTDKPKNFFKEQNIVKFEKVWYYHDYIDKSKDKPDLSYLSSFEDKYQIDLWQLAYNERIFFRYNDYYKFSNNEILSILEQECRLFEGILDEVKPDFLLTPMTTFHHNHLFYKMCKSSGVKVLMFIPTRLSQRVMISDDPTKFDILSKQVNHVQERTAEELLNYFHNQTTSRDTKEVTSKFLTSKAKLLEAALEFLFTSKNTNIKTHYTYYGRTKFKVLTNSIMDLLRKKYRGYFINKNLLREPLNESYILYPLHTEPERSLLLAAPFYTDQLKVIRDIAASLPIGYKLYVKEHPAQLVREWRKISFYKEVMKIPNVRLLHPAASTENLLKKCSLVITIGGTIGFESAFYEKPTISFIETIYSKLESVHTLKGMEELPKSIRTWLQKRVNSKDLSKFIDYLEHNSFVFPWIKLDMEIHNRFFHGGFLIDTTIEIPKMISFLEENSSIFNEFALEHIKRIKQYKELQNMSSTKL